MKFAYFSCARLNSTKIFNRCDENFTTKLSRIWACFLKYLLEFSISLTKKSITHMLIDKFTFQTDFFFYKKHTKCTLNLRLLDFPSADYSRKKTVMNSTRANLSLVLLPFFLQNDSLVFSSTSTFHLCISSVYFTVRRGYLLNLRKFYRASSISWRVHPRANGSGYLTNHERVIYSYVITTHPRPRDPYIFKPQCSSFVSFFSVFPLQHSYFTYLRNQEPAKSYFVFSINRKSEQLTYLKFKLQFSAVS